MKIIFHLSKTTTDATKDSQMNVYLVPMERHAQNTYSNVF